MTARYFFLNPPRRSVVQLVARVAQWLAPATEHRRALAQLAASPTWLSDLHSEYSELEIAPFDQRVHSLTSTRQFKNKLSSKAKILDPRHFDGALFIRNYASQGHLHFGQLFGLM
jgi:hypothetical protein